MAVIGKIIASAIVLFIISVALQAAFPDLNIRVLAGIRLVLGLTLLFGWVLRNND